MTASHGAAISVTIENVGGRSVFQFQTFYGEQLVVPVESRAILGKETQAFREHIVDFKDQVLKAHQVDGVKDLHTIGTALLNLYERGQTLEWRLFGEDTYPVQDLFRRACWAGRTIRDPLPLVEVRGLLEDMVPLEFMPLFDLDSHRAGLDDNPTISSPADLYKVASYFLGFSALVKRSVRLAHDPGKNDNKSILRNPKALPIKFFQHAGLPGATIEAEFFKANKHCIDLEGPWPGKRYTKAFLENRVAEHVWCPEKRFDGSQREIPDQIQHFACHCNALKKGTKEECFILSDVETRHVEVTLSTLQQKFTILRRIASRNGNLQLPLIFLNACEAVIFDPDALSSFTRFFLQNRNRGLIGTETRIPDKFAAYFSTEFYTRLLEGYSVGEAIHTARWSLLHDRNNPLGILYTLYANPDMYVLKPRHIR